MNKIFSLCLIISLSAQAMQKRAAEAPSTANETFEIEIPSVPNPDISEQSPEDTDTEIDSWDEDESTWPGHESPLIESTERPLNFNDGVTFNNYYMDPRRSFYNRPNPYTEQLLKPTLERDEQELQYLYTLENPSIEVIALINELQEEVSKFKRLIEAARVAYANTPPEYTENFDISDTNAQMLDIYYDKSYAKDCQERLRRLRRYSKCSQLITHLQKCPESASEALNDQSTCENDVLQTQCYRNITILPCYFDAFVSMVKVPNKQKVTISLVDANNPQEVEELSDMFIKNFNEEPGYTGFFQDHPHVYPVYFNANELVNLQQTLKNPDAFTFACVVKVENIIVGAVVARIVEKGGRREMQVRRWHADRDANFRYGVRGAGMAALNTAALIAFENGVCDFYSEASHSAQKYFEGMGWHGQIEERPYPCEVNEDGTTVIKHILVPQFIARCTIPQDQKFTGFKFSKN